MTDLSISIVSFHSTEAVRRLLRSILRHTTGISFSVYVIDNGAPEHDTFSSLSGEFPSVFFRTMDNRGYGAGHNLCLGQISATFHAVLTPDILITNDALTEMVRYLRDHPEAAAVTPQLRNADGTEQFVPRRAPSFRYVILGGLSGRIKAFRKYRDEYTMKGADFSAPVEVQTCSGCCTVMRTEAFRRAGGFDERYFLYFEDADLSARLAKQGKPMLLHDCSVIHEHPTESKKEARRSRFYLKSMLRYFFTHRKQRN